MAQAVQSVSLSLTLPISCHICLGKVRKPVVCCNHHVFCSACMELWLQKCPQCPTCRVAITPDNPCREIIGATDESHVSPSFSVRKHLRRTRVELLLQEYEDEAESLQQENSELRNRNLKLEAELEEALRPGSPWVPRSETAEPLECSVLKETENRLRAASELYLTVSQDLDKLRDANKTLRSQNVDLIQENVRLRGEVESRSPQKFGRYTVAALEAKISQYERDMRQLRKALERSDSYIEELEEQASRNHRNARTPGSDPENAEPGGSAPPTPSSALRGLNLDGPEVPGEKEPGSARPTYLRRLSFEGFTEPPSDQESTDGGGARRRGFSAEEARMDAAFLDKVSELDCMMAEGEGSRGRTRAELGATPGLTESGPRREEHEGGAEAPGGSGEAAKRKCSIGLVTSSPSKVSKIK